MYSLQYRPQMDHNKYKENGCGGLRPPPFSPYLLWSICGLYCRLYMADIQLMNGPYMAYVWPIYGLYSRSFIYAKFSIFASTPVFEHAHLPLPPTRSEPHSSGYRLIRYLRSFKNCMAICGLQPRFINFLAIILEKLWSFKQAAFCKKNVYMATYMNHIHITIHGPIWPKPGLPNTKSIVFDRGYLRSTPTWYKWIGGVILPTKSRPQQ